MKKFLRFQSLMIAAIMILQLILPIIPISVATDYETLGTKENPWNISATEDDNVIAYIEGTTLHIEGTGRMQDNEYWGDYPWNYSYVETIVEEENITEAIISEGITNAGSGLFDNCQKLERVYIPSTVTEIGNNIFSGCVKLKEVIIDENNQNYCSEDGVIFNKAKTVLKVYAPGKENTQYTLPNGVVEIEKYAFSDCMNLESINLPEGITTIKESAFTYCRNITNIVLPSSLISLGDCAFYGCEKLKTVEINENLADIREMTFGECYSLEEINVNVNNQYFKSEDGILFSKDGRDLYKYPAQKNGTIYTVPQSVIMICSNAFEKCLKLTDVTVSENAKLIGTRAFSKCKNIENVIMPNALEYIGYGAFEGCKEIKTITIPDGVTTIESELFSGCVSLENVQIPDTVTLIGSDAFKNCRSLKSIQLPSNLKEIFGWAFEGCISLEEIDIPEGTETISVNVFSNCESLKRIIIPASVNSIGGGSYDFGTFRLCMNLEEINVDPANQNYESDNGVLYTKGKETLIKYPSAKADATYNIPKETTDIEDDAFTACKHLTAINVDEENQNYSSQDGVLFNKEKTMLICYPSAKEDIQYEISADVYYIEYTAFMGCVNLQAINVEEGNNRYESRDGVLFEKPYNTLICYPAGRPNTEYSIPEGTYLSNNHGFYGCKNLFKIVIPEYMTYIGDFYGCESLQSIEFSEEIESIEYDALKGCKNLDSVVIPETVQSVMEGAFDTGKEGKTTVYYYSECPAMKEYAEEYYYEANFVAIGETEPDNPNDPEIPEEPGIEIEEYIKVIALKTSVSDFKAEFDEKYEVTLDNESVNYVGTGIKATIKENGKIISIVEVVVLGDVNGDGQATILDILEVNKVRLGSKTLEGAKAKAADATKDGRINIEDILRINKLRLKTA